MVRGRTGTLHPLILGRTEVLTTRPPSRWVGGRGGAFQNRPRSLCAARLCSPAAPLHLGELSLLGSQKINWAPRGGERGLCKQLSLPLRLCGPRGNLFHPNDANLPTPGAASPSPLPDTHTPCSAKGGLSPWGLQLAGRLPCSQGVGACWFRTSDSIVEALNPCF